MEENLLLKQPTDPRLVSDLPDMPPGVETTDDFDAKKVEKETSAKKSSRRSSPSPKRKSPRSRDRRSPTPPRRNRFRYSPERRGTRFDRRRSPPPPQRDRYRGRGAGGGRRGRSSSRSRSRSRSRSHSPSNRRSGRSRWSPHNKNNKTPPPTTAAPPPSNVPQMVAMPGKMMMTSVPPPAPNGQFGMMQTQPPPQMYGADAYAAYGQAYTNFGQQANAYAGNYNAAYTAPNTWTGHDAYAQQNWMQNTMPDTSQMPPAQPAAVEGNNFSNNANANQATAQHAIMPSAGKSDTSAHDAAVAQEAENQRDELKKQRSSYIQKNSVLKKELKMLRDQRKDLDSGTAPPSPTTKGFIDENEKLQSQIIKKIATIDNVIEMLTGVIGEEHLEQKNDIHGDVGRTDDKTTAGAASTKTASATIAAADISKLDPRVAKKSQQKRRTTSTSSNSSDGSHTTDSSSESSSESSSSTDNDDNKAQKSKSSNKNTTTATAGNLKLRPGADNDDDSSPERLKHKVMESMKSKQRTLSATALKDFPSLAEKMKSITDPEPVRYNYAFYDPEMHWCQKCNVFPKTAKDYLKHLHSKDHMDKENASETPWHTNLAEDAFPTYDNAQTKRMPIRGITFFTPATAWFCKLCSAWMGDLHCASVHLKSRQHSSKYTAFLERNPNFEMNWLADRQRILNDKSNEAAASQITAVSTTAPAEERENKRSKRNDEKSSGRKHKKNSDKKNKKKKKKQKKRKKAQHQDTSSDSSKSDSTSSDDVDEDDVKQAKKKKKLQKQMSPIKDLENPYPSASIRLSMRKGESSNKTDMTNIADDENQLPLPSPISITLQPNMNVKRPLGSWTLAQEGTGSAGGNTKPDDSIIQQWNSVQPVISDNEKKLLEQLKGKLKTTTTTSTTKPNANSGSGNAAKDTKDARDAEKFDDNSSKNRESRMERSYRGKRSRTRSPTRSRSRGRDWRRARSRSLRRRSRSRVRGRSRSRSRGRYSPMRGGRRRYSRSRSRRRRSRSRSRNRRNRRSRTRSRSGSRSGRGSPSAALTSASRIEKSVQLPHSEFRPRVPEKDKEKKSNDAKERKDAKKSTKTAPSSTSSAAAGKKLPFIGKMPVFKKQATGQSELEGAESATPTDSAGNGAFMTAAQQTATARPIAPTAEQIKMAMMEDVYGNAPPFHPDAGVMHAGMDYDDLMPDPVQFVNLMAQGPPAPPPPPPPLNEGEDDEADMLPPGIDETEIENEEFVAKRAPERDGVGEDDEDDDGDALPKDFEEALNIIFPGERKFDETEENSQAERERGETQIIVEQPVMQMDDLYKEGIHLVSIEETSMMAMDEASQLSMNEPLVFNNNASVKKSKPSDAAEVPKESKELVENSQDDQEQQQQQENSKTAKLSSSRMVEEIHLSPAADQDQSNDDQEMELMRSATIATNAAVAESDSIPMPISSPSQNTESVEQGKHSEEVFLNLDDIPQPPTPLTESEKQRRQEELDDLALLGIDADDMAAQCM